MRVALKRFGAWYWFHVKRAVWNWNCKDRSFKRQMLELWSFIIVIFVYKAVLIGLLLLAALAYMGLDWIGVP